MNNPKIPFFTVVFMLAVMCLFNFKLYDEPNDYLNAAIACFSGIAIFLFFKAFVKK